MWVLKETQLISGLISYLWCFSAKAGRSSQWLASTRSRSYSQQHRTSSHFPMLWSRSSSTFTSSYFCSHYAKSSSRMRGKRLHKHRSQVRRLPSHWLPTQYRLRPIRVSRLTASSTSALPMHLQATSKSSRLWGRQRLHPRDAPEFD